MSKNHKTEVEHHSELDLSSRSTSYLDVRRCFKHCVKDLTKRYLDEKEDTCSTNCLTKYQQIQDFLGQKMNNELNKLILMDPKVKMAFMKDQQKRFSG